MAALISPPLSVPTPASPLLLVDDNPADLLALEATLEPLGQPLVKARSGEEALEALLHGDFACILLDVQLPGLDGFATAELIRRRPRTEAIPLLFVTALAREEAQIVKGYAHGAMDYIVKPFSPDVLRAKVRTLIDMHQRGTRSRQEEAEARRQWLQAILQRVPVPLALLEPGTARITFSNGAADTLWGGPVPRASSVDEYTHHYVLTDAEGRELQAHEHPAVRTARGEEVSGVQVDFQTPRGKKSLLMDSAQVPAVGGLPPTCVLTFQDVTALKQVERALQKREREYRMLAESMPQLVWTATAEGHIDYINQVFARFIGMRPEEVLGLSWTVLLHPDERTGVMERWMHSVRTGEPYELEHRVRRHDGTWRWFLHRATFMEDAAGRPLKWFGSSTDIEEHKRVERVSRFLSEAGALLGSSLEYEETLHHLTKLAVPSLADWCSVDLCEEGGAIRRLAIAHVDPERLRSVWELERQAPLKPEDTWGVPEVLRTGRSRWVPVLTEPSPEDPERLRRLWRLGMRSSLIVPLIARDRVLGALSMVFAESGRRYTEEDVTLAEELARRAALAVDNARLYREAQQAVRLRDEFLSVASHELKTPLTPMWLRVRALQRTLQSTPGGVLHEGQVTPVLESVSKQLKKLSGLVDGLLDVSLLSTGRFPLQLSEVDLTSVVHEVVEAMESEAHQVGCSLFVRAVGPVEGHWDRDRLTLVVTHLLSNAIKYGAGRPVTLTVETAGDAARLEVRDEGIGIAPEHLPRIFGKFERAVSERNYGGLGLGLYISRGIVEALGGRVAVHSEPGQGATFTVELPRQGPPASTPKKAPIPGL